jgi:hypothetical protein
MRFRTLLYVVLVVVAATLIAGESRACNLPTYPSGSPFCDELDDWATIWEDAQTPGCDANAAPWFRDKLQTKYYGGGFTGFLAGSQASFAYETGLILGGRNLLSSDIDNLLGTIYYDGAISQTCGFSGPVSGSDPTKRWRLGDTCMDDYMIAAAAYAWRAAYMRKTSRWWQGDRASAISNLTMAFDTDQSICISKLDGATDPNKGPCDGTPADIANGIATVLPFNHSGESPAYGIGLITSMANVYLALQTAHAWVNPWFDFGSHYQDIQYILLGLFQEGQHAAVAGSFAFATDQCFNPSGSIYTDDDVAPGHRNRNCNDLLIGGGTPGLSYAPSMFPVRAFYNSNGFSTGDPNGYQFDGSDFPFYRFTSCNFWGRARRDVYYTIAYDWTAHPSLIPAHEGAGRVKVSIRTSNWRYVSADGGYVTAYGWSIGPSETFTMDVVGGGTLEHGKDVTIRTTSGYYFSAQSGGGDLLLANTTTAGPWETFRIYKYQNWYDPYGTEITDNDQFALVSLSTGTTYWMTADGGGGSVVNVTGTSSGPWQTFGFVRQN